MPTWFLVHSWGSSTSLLSLYSALMVLNAKSMIFLHSLNLSQSEMTHSEQKILVSILSLIKGIQNTNSNIEKNNTNFMVKEKVYLWNMIHTFVWWQFWNFIVKQLKLNKFLHPNKYTKMIFWYLERLIKIKTWQTLRHSLTTICFAAKQTRLKGL